MNISCNIIDDLLSLYTENMLSEDSRALVEEHISQCDECRARLEKCRAPLPAVTNQTEPEQRFNKYVSKKKKKKNLKTALIIILIIVLLGAEPLIFMFAGGFLIFGTEEIKEQLSPIKHVTEICEYNDILSVDKYGMDESIFPSEISDNMIVSDYHIWYTKSEPYECVGWLSVRYNREDYAKETERLKAYPSAEYMGKYGISGFNENYDLLAVYCGDNGLVYALDYDYSEIIYVELIFPGDKTTIDTGWFYDDCLPVSDAFNSLHQGFKIEYGLV